MTLSEETFAWLTTLPSPSFLLDELSSVNASPPFPVKEFSELLKQKLSLKSIEVEALPPCVRTPQTFLEGFQETLVKTIGVLPLEGALTCLISKEDMKTFFKQIVSFDYPIEEEYLKAFEYFIGAQILTALQEIPFDNTLSYRLLEETSLPNESALCQDVKICINGTLFFIRLITPTKLLNSWKSKFSVRKLSTLLERGLAQKIETTLQFEVGRVSLKKGELESLKKGDFVILDACYLNPKEDSGRILITLNGKPLFRGKLKDDKIKLYEYPLYQEEKAPMKDEETEWEEEEEEEEAFEEEEEVEEEEIEDSQEELEQRDEETKKAPKISIEELPIEVTVELGRLRLPLQKLLELEVGNHLELSLKKEDGVDLVVNGKCFAKAELLSLGDALGVRILDI
jgi:flagellar motor switch protein FliN/FliY